LKLTGLHVLCISALSCDYLVNNCFRLFGEEKFDIIQLVVRQWLLAAEA